MKKAIELYNDGQHRCLSFSNLVTGDGVQSNQFLIIDGKHEALIDPGGELTYQPLSLEVSKHINLRKLDYVLASHQDPDIISALGSWLIHTDCRVVCSKLWSRFLPHLASSFMREQMNVDTSRRVVGLPDNGGRIQLGESYIYAIPAHFLHSVGNFQFYDDRAKILFSGDMGASMVDDAPGEPVKDFDQHIKYMEGFHRRYMCANKACRLWANMVREMDVDMIVPQHGKPFVGKPMIERFLDWISKLECGIDLLTQNSYRMPR
jgi:flavorubredoxin